jgi:cation diffusion facilitator CzcD-associated flavoprotein CzcO
MPRSTPPPRSVETVIIGAGFSGLGAAIHLDRRGWRDWAILERGDDVGGTWRDNVYPGAACDIASHLYSFSFHLNPDWSHVYARQPEIQAYLKGCVSAFGLADRIHTGQTVTAAAFDDQTGRWTVTCASGAVVIARFLIFGVGGLKDPRDPAIPGWGSFEGPTLHTARWDHSVDWRGKRVGSIGTGASAIQVVPELAPDAAHLTVFQRTPAWVVPRNDRAFRGWEKAAFRRLRGCMRAERWRLYLRQEARYPVLFARDSAAGRLIGRLVAWNISRQIDDPALAHALTPDYRIGCKRVLVSDDWFPTLNRPDVALETRPIARVVPDGVVLDDDTHLPLDVLVAATGFMVDQPLGSMQVTGSGGLDIDAAWGDRPRAWLGVTMPGFPNAFLLLGPNTALGHNSVVVMIEAQLRYIMQGIAAAKGAGPDGRIDLREGLLDRFLDEMDARHAGQIWASGCNSWYLSSQGENFTLWPGSTLDYIRRTWRFDQENYRVDPAG